MLFQCHVIFVKLKSESIITSLLKLLDGIVEIENYRLINLLIHILCWRNFPLELDDILYEGQKSV